MSFSFKWPRFSDKFHADTMQMLDAALNKGKKPPIIEDRIEVVELEMGTQPPELEIRDIGDLTTDQFRGIFKLSYAGDAHIVLRTKVQANPLHHKKPGMDLLGGTRGILAAHQPLIVPMLLRLSNFKLNAYVVLVVSKQKGITLVFKTDPLQNVDVSSTFDSIAVIQKYIQKEIEGQLREMFREDLPGIIHRLSQRWIPGKSKVEAPYLRSHSALSRQGQERLEIMSSPDFSRLGPQYSGYPGLGIRSPLIARPVSLSGRLQPQRRTVSRAQSTASTSPRGSSSTVSSPLTPASPSESYTSFPDIENFDPTYGMRPEGLPTKSGYSGFGRLWTASRGLGDLAEETSEADIDDTERSFDVDWDVPDNSTNPPSSVAGDESTEYETIPAVGGGTITRPRIYHSQSLVAGSSGPSVLLPSPLRYTPSLQSSPYFTPDARTPLRQWVGQEQERVYQDNISAASLQALNHHIAASSLPGPSRPRVPMSEDPRLHGRHNRLHPSSHSMQGRDADSYLDRHDDGQHHRHPTSGGSSYPSRSSSGGIAPSVSTPPSSLRPPADDEEEETSPTTNGHRRKRSISPSILHPFDHSPFDPPASIDHGLDATDRGRPLRPGFNNTVKLSTLSHSNHTLSPFTRSLEHFTVRSVPHNRNPNQGGAPPPNPPERQPVKAKRKRIYRIGGKKANSNMSPSSPSPPIPSSPDVPSEYSEVDHYFRDSHHIRHRRTSLVPSSM